MGVRLCLVSTFAPTQCGIASFSVALATHLRRAGAQVGVVRLVDEPQEQVLPVVHQWVRGSRRGAAAAARVLDDHDVVVVQHEYGIFGGADGEHVLDLLELVHVPVVSVLHTVLSHPTPNQHRVLAALVARSDALVTMTETARERLIAGWGVERGRVVVIPHGAEATTSTGGVASAEPDGRRSVLTWGLLSQGKGIEWALMALAELRGSLELPVYRVVGRTHPRVLERDGEAYRERLLALTRSLGLESTVVFDDRYLSQAELWQVIRESDVVLLPYDSREQVTSGVLTEAVAAGKPVISTSFPHAVELLASGAGVLVPQGDPAAIAAALTRVLTDRGASERMAEEARGLASSLRWSSVAARYVGLAASVAGARLSKAV